MRSFLTPSNGRWSKSISVSYRHYTGDNRYGYLGFSLGTGISPDDRSQLNNVMANFNTYKAGVDFSKNLNPNTSMGISVNWQNEEYLPSTFGNQFGANISFQRRFK
jgi:YaiO family outer membrane protein